VGGWHEKLKGRVPDGPLVRELVEFVERLPSLDQWRPPEGIENRWTDLVRWGLPLKMTERLEGLDSLRRCLASEVLMTGRPTPDSFAELSGAGLCVALGAISGTRLPRSHSKTADWRLIWPTNATVDVEVTAAKTKAAHIERRRIVSDLAPALWREDRDFDLVADLADPTIREDRETILGMAPGVTLGRVEGVPGRWQLRAEPITRTPTTFLTGRVDERPAWWAASDARCFMVHAMVAGPGAARAPAQVRVYYGVPYNSYVNPVLAKANFPQGLAELPFLLAVDVSELPGAFRELPRVVADFLPNWQRVSGILLFDEILGADRVGWMWRLLKNPHAFVELPETLCSGRADLPGQMETVVQLANESKA
jgi:hypothetical protein